MSCGSIDGCCPRPEFRMLTSCGNVRTNTNSVIFTTTDGSFQILSYNITNSSASVPLRLLVVTPTGTATAIIQPGNSRFASREGVSEISIEPVTAGQTVLAKDCLILYEESSF